MTDKIDRIIEYFRNHINLGIDVNEIHQPYVGYMTSKEREMDDELEKQNKEKKMRMKYGKKWRAKTENSSQPPLRPGEVRKWNPDKKRYESNLD